jgi:hypothetical protein
VPAEWHVIKLQDHAISDKREELNEQVRKFNLSDHLTQKQQRQTTTQANQMHMALQPRKNGYTAR